MSGAVFGRAWFHVCLILGDHLLAHRQRVGAEGSREGEGDKEVLLSADVLLGAEPPAWTAGGCKDKRGDRCEWSLCKYEGYKTRLVYEKYQSNAEVLKKAGDKMRAMSEDQRQGYLEKIFLKQFKTGRYMHSTVGYMFEAEAMKCTWASDVLTEFQAWLKDLLPERHACVTKTVALHRENKQICSEVVTNEFKRTLRKACQEDLEPRDEETGETETKEVEDPYEVADTAALALSGGSLAGVITGIGFSTVAAGGLAQGLLIPMLLVGIPALAYMICVYWPKLPALKKKAAKIIKNIKRSRD